MITLMSCHTPFQGLVSLCICSWSLGIETGMKNAVPKWPVHTINVSKDTTNGFYKIIISTNYWHWNTNVIILQPAWKTTCQVPWSSKFPFRLVEIGSSLVISKHGYIKKKDWNFCVYLGQWSSKFSCGQILIKFSHWLHREQSYQQLLVQLVS